MRGPLLRSLLASGAATEGMQLDNDRYGMLVLISSMSAIFPGRPGCIEGSKGGASRRLRGHRSGIGCLLRQNLAFCIQ